MPKVHLFTEAKRLFILDRTPLKSINKFVNPPQSGDVIVFLSAAQDVKGTQTAILRTKKIISI